jgi:hypothetical protein
MADETAAVRGALQRLGAALDGLETAASELAEAGQRRAQRERGQAVMAEDRARLAEQLDAAGAQLARLEGNRREIAQRLDGAIATIRAVLARGDAGPGDAAI